MNPRHGLTYRDLHPLPRSSATVDLILTLLYLPWCVWLAWLAFGLQ